MDATNLPIHTELLKLCARSCAALWVAQGLLVGIQKDLTMSPLPSGRSRPGSRFRK